MDTIDKSLSNIFVALVFLGYVILLVLVGQLAFFVWFWHYTTRHDNDADIHRWAQDWTSRFPHESGWTDGDYLKEWSEYSDDTAYRVPGRYPPPNIKGVAINNHPLSNAPNQDLS